MIITTRTDKSLLMSILHLLIKPFGTALIKPKKQFPAGSPRLTPPSSATKKCTITERVVNGIYIYDFLPLHSSPSPETSNRKRKRIYYFAGGGWQMPPSPEHWKLLTELRLRLPPTTTAISLISYPLAPHSAAPSAYPQLQTLYGTLLRDAESANESVTLAGDSAGGNIALSLPLDALSRDHPSSAASSLAPASVFLISPAVDLTEQDEGEATEAQKRDPLLSIPFINGTAAAWRGEWDGGDVRVSPLFADVGVLARRGVRVYGISGSWDVLAPPAERFAQICREEGVAGEWLDWKGQMHCFLLAWIYGLRESKEAKEWMVDVLGRES